MGQTQPYNVVKTKENVVGTKVMNRADEDLGKICEVMLDKTNGRVAYIVLESGSFLGLGGKLFALPWSALNYDANKDCYRIYPLHFKMRGLANVESENYQ